MPYNKDSDPFATISPTPASPARNMIEITPADEDLAIYPKALRIYVPSAVSEATVNVVPATAGNDTPVALKFPTGLWDLPVQVRQVRTGTTGGIEIHGYMA